MEMFCKNKNANHTGKESWQGYVLYLLLFYDYLYDSNDILDVEFESYCHWS